MTSKLARSAASLNTVHLTLPLFLWVNICIVTPATLWSRLWRLKHTQRQMHATIYQAMFGSPRAQFRAKAVQVVARFPQLPQPTTITPQNVVADMELYITAGRDELCGDVVRLTSFMPVEGLEELGERLGYNDVENMLIGAAEITKAPGAGGEVLDWDANSFLFQTGGIQLFSLKKKLRKLKNVVIGQRYLDTARVGVNPPGHDADASFSLDFDSNMHQRY